MAIRLLWMHHTGFLMLPSAAAIRLKGGENL